MKNLKRIALLIIALIIAMTVNVYASDFSIKLKMEEEDSSTYVLKIILDELNFSGAGMNAFICDIEYDEDVFEEITAEDISPQNNWGDLTYNQDTGTILVLKSDFTKQSDEEILEIKLKTKVSKATTRIKVTNIQASNSQSDLESNDQVLTFKINTSTSLAKKILIIVLIILVVLMVLRGILNLVKKGRKRK